MVEELVTYLARSLVDRPEQVELRSQVVDGGTVLELKVAPEDVGKVIGRDGRTINAMRAVLAVAAQRKGAKVRLEVLDDRRNAAAPSPPRPAAPAESGPDAGGDPPGDSGSTAGS
ncbi:MAG TPA: KH domain-containing protein [Myxococcaceae bacterium]|nr:KH domain-containing protein [Myxococcaceae bacterium]